MALISYITYDFDPVHNFKDVRNMQRPKNLKILFDYS